MATPFADRVWPRRAFGYARGATSGTPSTETSGVDQGRVWAQRVWNARAFAPRAFAGSLGSSGTILTSSAAFHFDNLSGPTYHVVSMNEERRLYPGNAYTMREQVTRFDPATATEVPVTGLLLTGYLAAAPTDTAPIDPAVQAAMTEDAPGFYTVTFAAAALAAITAAYANETVWEVITNGADLRVAHAVLVPGVREGF